jgi:hypothetical protein
MSLARGLLFKGAGRRQPYDGSNCGGLVRGLYGARGKLPSAGVGLGPLFASDNSLDANPFSASGCASRALIHASPASRPRLAPHRGAPWSAAEWVHSLYSCDRQLSPG